MRSFVKRSLSVVLISGMMFSMSGCFNLLFGKNTTALKGKHYKEMLAELEEDNMVKDWEGSVPSGMEVSYVLVKEQRVDDNDNYNKEEYGYDGKGRQCSCTSYRLSGYMKWQNMYDDEGLLIRREFKSDGYIGSAPAEPDYRTDYEYNAAGQLVSYEKTELEKGGVERVDYIYDEDGHLAAVESSDTYSNNTEYTSNFETLPYYEYVVVVNDDYSSFDVDIVQRFYDEDGLVISEINGNMTTTYEYENGVLTGYRSGSDYGTTVYDAEGNSIRFISGSGNTEDISEYNEHNDRILYQDIDNGEVVKEVVTEYKYDKNGNKLEESSRFTGTYSSGEEYDFVSVYTYTYDEHGLLISEENRIDGRFVSLETYNYEAILVSVEK